MWVWRFYGDFHRFCFSVGMGWVWGLKFNPHGSPGIYTDRPPSLRPPGSGGARVSGARGHRSFWRPPLPFPPLAVEVGALEIGFLKPS